MSTFTTPPQFKIGDTVTFAGAGAKDATLLVDTIRACGEGPWTVQILPAVGSSANTNWSTIYINNGGNDILQGGLESTGALNASVSFPVVLIPGTWTLNVMFKRGLQGGIITADLDGTTLGTIDTYGAAAAEVWGTIASITSGTGKPQTLTFTMATRNVSATSYKCTVKLITFYRTA